MIAMTLFGVVRAWTGLVALAAPVALRDRWRGAVAKTPKGAKTLDASCAWTDAAVPGFGLL